MAQIDSAPATEEVLLSSLMEAPCDECADTLEEVEVIGRGEGKPAPILIYALAVVAILLVIYLVVHYRKKSSKDSYRILPMSKHHRR